MIKKSNISLIIPTICLLLLAIFVMASEIKTVNWVDPSSPSTINGTYVFNTSVTGNFTEIYASGAANLVYNATIFYRDNGTAGAWTDSGIELINESATPNDGAEGVVSMLNTNSTKLIPDGNYTINVTVYATNYSAQRVAVNSTTLDDIIIDNSPPTVIEINVSDGVSTHWNDSDLKGTRYLKNATITVTVVINETVAFGVTPKLYWNVTETANFSSIHHDYVNLTNLSTATGAIKQFNATFAPSQFDHGTNFSFLVVVNDTSARNISIVDGVNDQGFNFTIDATAPSTPTVTAPSDTTVDALSSSGITYSCQGSDDMSSIDYTWTLTYPSDDTTTFNGSSSVNFNGTTIDDIGEYDVKCTVTDEVGYSTDSSTYNFDVSASETTGGGSGGEGEGEDISEDVEDLLNEVTGETHDLGTISTTGKSQKVMQGDGGRFVLAGETHAFKIETIGESYVTLTVASPNPQEITINTGETRELDVNEDGTEDLSITLNSVSNGEADITFTGMATGQEGEGEGEIIEEGTSLIWLWILIIAVVVIGVAYYFMSKKKK